MPSEANAKRSTPQRSTCGCGSLHLRQGLEDAKISRNVEGSVKKTGLSGIAGNKGAVAIRLDYANTPICLVHGPPCCRFCELR